MLASLLALAVVLVCLSTDARSNAGVEYCETADGSGSATGAAACSSAFASSWRFCSADLDMLLITTEAIGRALPGTTWSKA